MSQNSLPKSAIKIGKTAFLISAGIILVLIVFSGILTILLPAGEYDRVLENGRTVVVQGSYHQIERPDYPIWRWFTAPLEVLFTEGNAALITIILFILCVGGSISILERAGVMEALIRLMVNRFSKRKYLLLGLIIFFFLFVSSFIGVYEGLVPMIIFLVPVAISLGWDSLTGLGMTLLPLAFGFASGVTNPFTVAVAQRVADLPLFSGSWLRIIFFFTVYILVTLFVGLHAKKVEKDPRKSLSFLEDEKLRSSLSEKNIDTSQEDGASKDRHKALLWFSICVGIAMVIVFATVRIPGLSDLAFPIMALLFLIGGIGGGFIAHLSGREVGDAFFKGALNFLPGIALILMAYSVKHVIVSGKIMDTILYGAASAISKAEPMAAAFLVYLTTLIMNFFIGSASAKAFLMMPVLAPLADLVGITRQTAVLAFDFGDGFSNMFYPTNALLLIALSFTVISYPKWIRWTWKLQLIILATTSAFLAFAVYIGFGPF